MIKFEFSKPNNKDVSGIIKATVIDNDQSYNYPLDFKVYNIIDNSLCWYTKLLSSGYWCSYSEPCNKYIEVSDSLGNILITWRWDTLEHGDFIHKSFYNWCGNNKGAKGIAIGTHDGTTGEWVVPVNECLSEAFLVEVSQPQYDRLVNNYSHLLNVKTIKSLITPNGGKVDFYEGDDEYTNSVIKDHSLKYNNNVRSVKKDSISINDLIINCGLKDSLDWLHIDVEGIDGELIMALDDSIIKLPRFIIYESLNLSDTEKIKIIEFLENKNYICKDYSWNTIAIKII